MALLKFKKLMEDIQTGSHLVLDPAVPIATVPTATYAGTAAYAGTASLAGTLSGSQIHGGAGTHAY